MKTTEQQLFHLWRTDHIEYVNSQWANTGKYKNCVNNSSGLYYTNKSVDSIIKLANNSNIDDSSLKKEESYKYYASLK